MTRKSPHRHFLTRLGLSCLSALVPLIVQAQAQKGWGELVSPGPLAAPHAGLEGVSNCTRCHDVGRKVSDRKCLNCHAEIAARMEKGLGYHARVRDRACVSCHSDHNGRDYQMVRWGEGGREKFDHVLTGYHLEGKHVALACDRCHRPDFIRDDGLRGRPGIDLQKTLLGLSPACQSCHPDAHRGQLGPDCGTCHGPDAWRPAGKFSHDRSRYKLVGKHVNVACVKCHPQTTDQTVTSSAVTFVRYTGLSFQECAPCHQDVHKGGLGADCQRCHNPQGWSALPTGLFDHSRTRYPLKGKHLTVACERCHGAGEGWRRVLKFDRCADCHADAHRGEFARREDKGACEACHTAEGFLPATYDVVEHRRSRYPLTGGHVATPCNACHVKVDAGTGREWVRFTWDQTACSDCHRDAHNGQFARAGVKEACEACHQPSSWRDLRFNHDDSRFRLTGKHAQVACDRCHLTVDAGTADQRVLFKPLPVDCQSCHRDVHYQQFAKADAKTACEGCHSTEGWRAVPFDHNGKPRFKLTGAHEKARCEKCHLEVQLKKGVKAVLYRPIATACAACHQDVHKGVFRE